MFWIWDIGEGTSNSRIRRSCLWARSWLLLDGILKMKNIKGDQKLHFTKKKSWLQYWAQREGKFIWKYFSIRFSNSGILVFCLFISLLVSVNGGADWEQKSLETRTIFHFFAHLRVARVFPLLVIIKNSASSYQT